MLTGAHLLHLQTAQQRVRHNGQDGADPNDTQSNAAEEEVFPVSITNETGCLVTVQVHSGMTVMELKQLYQVCSYACEAVMCIRICLTPELYLNVRPHWALLPPLSSTIRAAGLLKDLARKGHPVNTIHMTGREMPHTLCWSRQSHSTVCATDGSVDIGSLS
jgi:hypothetical protein